MKNILSLLLMAFVAIGMQAQGTVHLGYCGGEAADKGSISTEGKAWVSAAIYLPADMLASYEGSTITALRGALASKVNVDSLCLWVRTSLTGDNIAEAIITTKTGANACAFGVTNGLIVEIVLTMLFVLVVLGATSKTNGATNNFAGLAIGLSLILIHLVGIHFTGTSVNPARSIGPALFEGGQALSDLWVFIVGPFVGGALAACIWKIIGCDCCKKTED